jgi:signal transduction histidine kinase
MLLHAAFTRLPDGTRGRTVTIRTPARSTSGAAPVAITATLTSSAADFDRLLNRLAWALLGVCVIGAAIAAAIARVVAIRALQPLRATADVVGEIDDRTLHRRIDENNLPPELLPVASKLNQMLQRLEDSSQQRRQFVADASHELRTPVAALVTALEVALRRERDAESYRQTIHTGLTDARLLQRLVEALLAQIKSEWPGQQQPAETEPVDVGRLIRQSVEALSPLAQAKSVRIEVDAEPDITIVSQPARLSSILLNLIGNAIEHNRPGGQVNVSCRFAGRELQLDVQDNGAGIPKEHVAHVFEPFYRADTARSSGHLGLGLYLVHTHARALGGTCEVQSETEVGTRFCIRFPAVRDAPATAAANVGSPDKAEVAST